MGAIPGCAQGAHGSTAGREAEARRTSLNLEPQGSRLLLTPRYTADVWSWLTEQSRGLELLSPKSHRLAGLNNRKLMSHSSGGQKSKIKVSAGLVSPAASPWRADGCFLSVLTKLPVCALSISVCPSVLL